MGSVVVTYLLLTFFFQCSLQENPYNFRPEARHIEVNIGDSSKYIGFDEIKNHTAFGHCYIQSDTINVDYPILAPDNTTDTEEVQSDILKEFSPSDTTGSCAFVYHEVDAIMPLKWTITAYDNITEKNYTEEVTITVYYNMALYLDGLVGLPSSSVANFYITGSTKLKNCTLSFGESNIELDMNAIKVYNDNNVFKSRLTSLGGGRCGYKINNLVLTDSQFLTLYATDDKGTVYRNSSQLVVEAAEVLQNRTEEVYLGDPISVVCGKAAEASGNFDQKFCHLYNPKGVLVSHGHLCDYKLDIITMSDIGRWRCSVGYDYIMEALEFTTDLVAKSSRHVTTFTKNGTDFYIISCQLINYTKSSVEYCKFTRPDGNIFKVTTGGVTVNYNTFSTDLANGKCSLEMLKPLRNEDKGSWKCEAILKSGDIGGAFIEVESSKKLFYNKHMQYNVKLGSSFEIDCMVPYSFDHCYIIAPHGVSYEPKEITTGLCSFTVDEATIGDNGTWQCSIAQRNGIPDEIIAVEISIIDFKVLFSDVEAAENEDAELVCNTNGIPIEYCRFVSPQGLSYSLREENSTSTSKISYHGRGLEYGDCGVKITKIDRTYDGQWSCHISSKRSDNANKTDLEKNMALKIIPPRSLVTIADSFGIAFGVVAAIIIVGGIFFYKYARRSGDNIEAAAHHSERHSDSSDSNTSESVILEVGQSAIYNAQE